jgi:hypothetical protein
MLLFMSIFFIYYLFNCRSAPLAAASVSSANTASQQTSPAETAYVLPYNSFNGKSLFDLMDRMPILSPQTALARGFLLSYM